jgi:hypothetical protein
MHLHRDCARELCRAADVLIGGVHGHARYQRHLRERRASGGQLVDQVAVDDALLVGALHIDNRRLAADRNSFLQRANTKLRVDRRGERSGQLNAFPFHRAEPAERERDRVRSRGSSSIRY